MSAKRNPIQELEAERTAALDLLERTDRAFLILGEGGYLSSSDKSPWEDIREFLRNAP